MKTTRPSPPPRMSEEDVGSYFVHDDGSVWMLVGYAAHPTATLERCERVNESADVRQSHPARVGGVVGAPIFGGFRRLRTEGEA